MFIRYTREGWEKGIVTALLWEQPPGPSGGVGIIHPYQIRLDNGGYVFSPVDSEYFIASQSSSLTQAQYRTTIQAAQLSDTGQFEELVCLQSQLIEIVHVMLRESPTRAQSIFNQLFHALKALHRNEQALSLAQDHLQSARRLGIFYAQTATLSLMSEIHMDAKQYDEGIRVLEECRRIELDVGPIVCGEMIIDCFRLADMYMCRGLSAEDVAKATEYFELFLSRAQDASVDGRFDGHALEMSKRSQMRAMVYLFRLCAAAGYASKAQEWRHRAIELSTRGPSLTNLLHSLLGQ